MKQLFGTFVANIVASDHECVCGKVVNGTCEEEIWRNCFLLHIHKMAFEMCFRQQGLNLELHASVCFRVKIG